MCQCHSLPISEPVSHAASLMGGLLVYGLLRMLTVGPETALTVAGVVAVIANFWIGCKINLIMFDLLGALLGRPISALLAFKILAWMVNLG